MAVVSSSLAIVCSIKEILNAYSMQMPACLATFVMHRRGHETECSGAECTKCPRLDQKLS